MAQMHRFIVPLYNFKSILSISYSLWNNKWLRISICSISVKQLLGYVESTLLEGI